MPYPCSPFYFDINFGNRLYSKAYNQSKSDCNQSDYMNKALVLLLCSRKTFKKKSPKNKQKLIRF